MYDLLNLYEVPKIVNFVKTKKNSLWAVFLLIEMIIFVVSRKDKWYNVSRNMW